MVLASRDASGGDRTARTSLPWPGGPAGAPRPAARPRGRGGARPGDARPARRTPDPFRRVPAWRPTTRACRSHRPSRSGPSAPGSPRARHLRIRQPPRRTTVTTADQMANTTRRSKKTDHAVLWRCPVAWPAVWLPATEASRRPATGQPGRAGAGVPSGWPGTVKVGIAVPLPPPSAAVGHIPGRPGRRRSWSARTAASRIWGRNRPPARCGHRHSAPGSCRCLLRCRWRSPPPAGSASRWPGPAPRRRRRTAGSSRCG